MPHRTTEGVHVNERGGMLDADEVYFVLETTLQEPFGSLEMLYIVI